jgi:hypothetical protein
MAFYLVVKKSLPVKVRKRHFWLFGKSMKGLGGWRFFTGARWGALQQDAGVF